MEFERSAAYRFSAVAISAGAANDTAPSGPAKPESSRRYHVVTRGACWGRAAGSRSAVRLEPGDVLVFPRGDAYAMAIDPPAGGGPAAPDVLEFMRQMSLGRLPFAVDEGGPGPVALELVCGFLACDLRPFNPLLATLPPMLRIRPRPGPAADSLRQLVALTVAESRHRRAGGECIRLGLSELMFVEVVRRHLAARAGAEPGWLAGLRDPAVGRALCALHDHPADAWTLRALAREVAIGRSALAARFARFTGHPPMQYLARWRMQLAARRLADGDAKVAAIAADVGYESEAAFSRAFKRAAGMPPAEWRRRAAREPAFDGRRPRRR